jgi:hypothetical protein
VPGTERLTERVSAFARLDRMFDANPEGDRIPNLAFDPGAASNLAILGGGVPRPALGAAAEPFRALAAALGAGGLARVAPREPRASSQ